MIIIAGTMTVDPDRRDEMLAAAELMMRATHAEKGCLAYVFSAHPYEPETVQLFEKWENAEDLGPHSSSEHMATFRAAIAGIVQGADVLRYEIASEGPLR